MRRILRFAGTHLGAFFALLCVLASPLRALEEFPQDPSVAQINLSSPENSIPLVITIAQGQSEAYRWKPGQTVKVSAYAERPDGRKENLRDFQGKRFWLIRLNEKGEGELAIIPHEDSFTGRLVISGNGKTLFAATPYLSEMLGRTLEKVYEYRFPDGAAIQVHFTDQILAETRQQSYFPKEVLNAAVSAYQTITQFQGFHTQGYAYASPDKTYAYDPDRTIDIYLGNPDEKQNFSYHGFNPLSFKDAPCFDTVRVSDTGFHAVILLPANYAAFIKNWEKINPSPLGARNVEVDLHGTLIHEMLHVVLFYYNRNLNKDLTDGESGKSKAPAKKLDWYVEGLARYFETFAGARHDFYSQGFKEILPDKIRFSRGGSNYFMRYPDQAFTELRYENALFWRFIDMRYGMTAIERLSREFRGIEPAQFRQALEKVTENSFSALLKEFAVATLLKDFGLKEDSRFLKEIAKTKLMYDNRRLYLRDGYGVEKSLGLICETDWIGGWDNRASKHGEVGAAGDNTDASDVSGWATDFYEILFKEGTPTLPSIAVVGETSGEPLLVQVILVTRGGSLIKLEDSAHYCLEQELKNQSLGAQDIEKAYLLITNPNAHELISYKIRVKP